jgi:hypothetical protein
MKTRFLDSNIEVEVVSNQTLFVAWCLTIDTVDSEIDPTHNPDWVKSRKQREQEHLVKLKSKIAMFLKERKNTNHIERVW